MPLILLGQFLLEVFAKIEISGKISEPVIFSKCVSLWCLLIEECCLILSLTVVVVCPI